MEHNLDELEAPQWMDKNFFTTVLKSSIADESLNVSGIVIAPATKPGDHFASIMFRVKVNYTTKTQSDKQISLIVKTEPHEEGIKKDMLGQTPIYDTEMNMYCKTIPEMERLLRTAEDNTIIAPKIIYYSKKPMKVIVLEDLALKNYVMTPTFLNLNASKIVFERLGKWHACSYFMDNVNSDKNSSNLSSYNVHFFNGQMDGAKNFLTNNVTEISNYLKEWKGFEKFEDNFRTFKDNFEANGKKAYTPNTQKSGGYNVLNHGDFHFKNMMFLKEDNEISDVIFIDFQICTYGSPAIDLLYALAAVSDYDCRNEHRLELIHHYYQAFVSTLKSTAFLGKIPTMLDLQIELLKFGFIEIMITMCFLPFMYIDFTKFSMEDIMGPFKTISMEQVLNTPEVQRVFRKCIPEFVLKGIMQ